MRLTGVLLLAFITIGCLIPVAFALFLVWAAFGPIWGTAMMLWSACAYGLLAVMVRWDDWFTP